MDGQCLAITVTVLALCLSGCNTTDALTPQVDVGGGLFPSSSRSTPVTQEEANRLAGRDAYPPAPSHDSRPEPDAHRPSPQNSMAAQAQAIDDGLSSPVQSSPIQSAPLDPPGGVPPSAQPPTVAASPPPVAADTEPKAETAVASTIRFLPIIGAPVQAVTPLSRQLGASARASGLLIRSSTDTSSEHILKGYLSAFDSDGKVTVIYVWDVLDAAGARLHRIQGQETVPASQGDPWAAVPAATMQLIGQKTIAGYMQWRESARG